MLQNVYIPGVYGINNHFYYSQKIFPDSDWLKAHA